MPDNASVFALGLVLGTALLVLGFACGYWLAKKNSGKDLVDRRQFLEFLKELSQWTSEFSGDVSKYQSQLSSINEQVRGTDAAPKEELMGMVSKIMQVNQKLQERLDNAEKKLESQSGDLANYLVEARTDPLTKLQNRRSFDRTLDELLVDWRKRSRIFTLGLIDIDHFKNINDTFGHQAGDFVLQRVAEIIEKEFGSESCSARYGGEEFAVLLPADGKECSQKLEHLRQVIEKATLSFDDQSIPITCCCGGAEIASSEEGTDLVRRADEALYAAKLDGRNRVFFHDGTICRLITRIDEAADPIAEDDPQADESLAKVNERLQRIVSEESQRILGR